MMGLIFYAEKLLVRHILMLTFFVAMYLLFCDDGLNLGCYGIVKDYGVSGLSFETINPNSHQDLWFN